MTWGFESLYFRFKGNNMDKQSTLLPIGSTQVIECLVCNNNITAEVLHTDKESNCYMCNAKIIWYRGVPIFEIQKT